MPLLGVINEKTFGRQIPGSDVDFRQRHAVRAILLDSKGGVYLTYVEQGSFYELPGGGQKPDETKKETLRRELKEEVGAQNIVIGPEIGTVIEYRYDPPDKVFEHHSTVYMAKQTGSKLLTPTLDTSEISSGLRIEVVDSIEAAIVKIMQNKTRSITGEYIQKRDLLFLLQAKKQMGMIHNFSTDNFTE